MAPQPRPASCSPHGITPPRHPLPLSLLLSFSLNRPLPSHLTLLNSPTHPHPHPHFHHVVVVVFSWRSTDLMVVEVCHGGV